MKLYLISPKLPANTDREAVDARLRACIQPIADLIAAHIEDDPCLFGMWHEGEVALPAIEPEAAYGSARVARLDSSPMLRTVLAECGDPFGGSWMLIRSLVTCRSVRYGYDGQAFVCLTASDGPLASPDESLIVVEECSHLLWETDWMDGLNLD